jgi:hypothetical protein
MNIPPGRLEYMRRWLLCHKAIREGRWDDVRKWAKLCDCWTLYESAWSLYNQGIDLSGGFI